MSGKLSPYAFLRLQKDALVLLNEQKEHIHNERVQALALIEATQSALSRLERAERNIDNRIQQTKALIDAETSAVHGRHISALPEDLLRLIFLEYAAGASSEWFGGHRAKAPFIVASVCKAWRRVSLRCHTLWNYIEVPEGSDVLSGPQTMRMISALHCAIERSGASPLDIYCAPSARWGELHRSTWNLFVQNHFRWRRLHLQIPSSVPPDFYDVFRLPMPLLEDVHMGSLQPIQQQPVVTSSYFPNRSSLRTFVCGIPHILFAGCPGFSSRMTYFTCSLAGVTPSAAWSVFKECASTLEYIAVVGVTASADKQADLITMPNLLKFHVGQGSGFLRYMSGYLDTPQIQRVFFGRDTSVATRDFIRGFTGGRTLGTLILKYNTLDRVDAELFRSLICLSTLVAESCVEDFISALAHPDGEWILPSIKNIEFQNLSFPSGSIAELVRARRVAAQTVPKSVVPIQHIHFRNTPANSAHWTHFALLDEFRKTSNCTSEPAGCKVLCEKMY